MAFNGYGCSCYGDDDGDGYGCGYDGDYYGGGIGSGVTPVYTTSSRHDGHGDGRGHGTALTTTDGDGWVIHILTAPVIKGGL
jgi:hypothetical protein